MPKNFWKYLIILTFFVFGYLFYSWIPSILYDCWYSVRDVIHIFKKIKSVESIKQDIFSLQTANEKMKNRIMGHYNSIPSMGETAEVLRVLKKNADINDILIIQIVPHKIEKHKNFSVQDVEVMLVGNFTGCLTFMNYFETQIPYIKIGYVDLSRSADKIKMKILFKVFFRNDPMESK